MTERRLVRRRNEAEGIGRDMCCEGQVWIERRVDAVERYGSHQARVVAKGAREGSGKVEAAGALTGDVHYLGTRLAAQERQQRVGQVVNVGR